ncbi:NUDIX hydrolase [Maribacter sp. 2-571]|uniref:NUDIX hydrolase n=1 Tax=Maribacter sp. 2-571 TaxID=3417569 RepID=UPI003D333A09
MDFQVFTREVSKIKKLPLPGEASHYKMMPAFRQKELDTFITDRQNSRKAAVMALFYSGKGKETHFLLILRKTYEGVHSNQVALPGGKAELSDADLLETALRETKEEVGVSPKAIQVIKPLSKVYIPPSNFEVQPFLGFSEVPLSFVAQESEVAALVEVRLRDLLDDANVFDQRLNTSYAKNVSVPAFRLNGHTVWGATAMMLSELKELFSQVW